MFPQCDDAPTDESHAGRLLDLIQGRGVACLIEADARLAERLGTDGLHIAADDEAYRKARDLCDRRIVASEEECDLAFVFGIGFAMYLGGPIFYAKQRGWV